jgi:putative Mg2+ transporter-C (MgtC) family protein
LLASSVPTLSGWEVLLRLGAAALLGGAVGLERELRERQAGLRTHLLVSVGSALFTLVSAYGFHEFLVNGGNVVRADPSRIAAQIVSGIGFLGAGAIIRQGLSVRGLTTAATLWLVAAIGMASGAGYYDAAIITTVGAIVTLWPLRILAFKLVNRFRAELRSLFVQMPPGETPAGVIAEVERAGARLESVAISQEGDRRSVELVVEIPPELEPARIVASIADIEGVLEVRWGE